MQRGEKLLAFRQYISIISDGDGKCKEKYSRMFIYNLQLNLYIIIDKRYEQVYDTGMRKEMTLRENLYFPA